MEYKFYCINFWENDEARDPLHYKAQSKPNSFSKTNKNKQQKL